MSVDHIDQSFGGTFPRQALPEVLKVASEIIGSFAHLACDTAERRGWKSLSNGELARPSMPASNAC
jgi:hypothetical protein